MEMENLTIGAVGWLRNDWIGNFYPEDLPEEWRLDFYSNQFYCVLVKQEDWLEWSEDDCEEMADALEGESFRFIYEIQSCLNAQELSHLTLICELLDELSNHLLFRPRISPTFDSTSKLASLLITQQHQANPPEKNTQGVDWVWCWEGCQLTGEPLGLLGSLPEDPKQQVAVLKSFMESLPKGRLGAPFIIEGQVEISQLNHLKTVAELLGY